MSQERPDRTGGENPGVDADVAGRGDEGERSEQVTPPIGDDAEHDQTESPAPPDDVGVPPDEEMNRDET